MPNTDQHHARVATAWACYTLRILDCQVIANNDGSWDIEAKDGWKTAENWRELCAIAGSMQRERQLSKR